MNKIFTTKNKCLIGIAAIIVAIIIGIITKFSYSTNAVMSIVMSIAMLTFANMLISKIFKTDISYILYICGNMAGALIALFVVSKSKAMSNLYMILFLLIIFVALWIYHMCIMNIEEAGKRIVFSLIGNIISVVFEVAGTFIVIAVSVVVTMLI